MATQRDSAPALEETEAIGPDETTQADEEWPVAREYRVPDDGNGGIPPSADEAGEIVVTPLPRPRRLPLYLGAGLLGALLAALLLLGVAWLWPGGDDRSPSEQASPPANVAKPRKAASASVAVPDVLTLEATRARSILEDAGLRVEIRRVAAASGSAAPDEVLRQAPAAGIDVKAGTVVVLTVSGAQPRIQVPEVVGLMASDATRALRDASFRAEVRLVRSAKPAGTVLDQAPSAGTELAAESAVRLEVAKASPPVTIAVPRLIGSTASEAKARLRGLGLRWTASTIESPKLEGTVVGQSPNAGSRLRKGQSVTLEISAGPPQVTVPDVTGLEEQSARAQLEAAGFVVQVSNEVTTDPSQDGMVTSQAPIGGSKSDKAGTVTLTVARLG